MSMKSRKLYWVILSFLYMKFPENGTEFQTVSHPVSYFRKAFLTTYLDNILGVLKSWKYLKSWRYRLGLTLLSKEVFCHQIDKDSQGEGKHLRETIFNFQAIFHADSNWIPVTGFNEEDLASFRNSFTTASEKSATPSENILISYSKLFVSHREVLYFCTLK